MGGSERRVRNHKSGKRPGLHFSKNTNLSPPNRDLRVSQRPALQESLRSFSQRGT